MYTVGKTTCLEQLFPKMEIYPVGKIAWLDSCFLRWK